jgi:hypothetical protein
MNIYSGFYFTVFIFNNGREPGLKSGPEGMLDSRKFHLDHSRRHVFIYDFEYVFSISVNRHQKVEVLTRQALEHALHSVLRGQALAHGLPQVCGRCWRGRCGSGWQAALVAHGVPIVRVHALFCSPCGVTTTRQDALGCIIPNPPYRGQAIEFRAYHGDLKLEWQAIDQTGPDQG